jgi:UDP-GlcNAc:undecaprenyl-phosphate GlcNAc-1-phosphate transferase
VAILGTFYVQETTPSRVAIAAPLLALSVPIFDTLSVVYIRWRRGESIMKGDKRHFSHRLTEIGMSPHHAVEFIYLVGAVTGLGAALLPHVGWAGTVIVLTQAAGVYCLIVLLMNSGTKREPGR